LGGNAKRFVRAALVAAACGLMSAPPPASAQGVENALGDAMLGKLLLLFPLLLLPSAIGMEHAFDEKTIPDGRLLLGWPVQWPLSVRGDISPHRAVAAVEIATGARDRTFWRVRAGYRYAGSRLMAGGGVGVDGAAWVLSPEIGLRLPRRKSHHGIHPHAMLVMHTDVPPTEPGHPRVSLTIGWALF
jgi:hypothetical protein